MRKCVLFVLVALSTVFFLWEGELKAFQRARHADILKKYKMKI